MDGDQLLFNPLEHMAAESSREARRASGSSPNSTRSSSISSTQPSSKNHHHPAPATAQQTEQTQQQTTTTGPATSSSAGARAVQATTSSSFSSSSSASLSSFSSPSSTSAAQKHGRGDGKRRKGHSKASKEAHPRPGSRLAKQPASSIRNSSGRSTRPGHPAGSSSRHGPSVQTRSEARTPTSSTAVGRRRTAASAAAAAAQSLASSLFSFSPRRATVGTTRRDERQVATPGNGQGSKRNAATSTTHEGRASTHEAQRQRKRASIHGVIHLHIGATRDLGIREVSDFVVAVFLDGAHKGKTALSRATVLPSWDDALEIRWAASEAPLFLELRLYEQGRISSDTLLGVVLVPVGVKRKLRRTQWFRFRSAKNARWDVGGGSIKLDFSVYNPKGVSEKDYTRFRRFCRQHDFDLPVLLDPAVRHKDSYTTADGDTVGFVPGPDEEIEVWEDDVFVAIGQRQARGTVILTNYRLVTMERPLEARSGRNSRSRLRPRFMVDSVSEEDLVLVSPAPAAAHRSAARIAKSGKERGRTERQQQQQQRPLKEGADRNAGNRKGAKAGEESKEGEKRHATKLSVGKKQTDHQTKSGTRHNADEAEGMTKNVCEADKRQQDERKKRGRSSSRVSADPLSAATGSATGEVADPLAMTDEEDDDKDEEEDEDEDEDEDDGDGRRNSNNDSDADQLDGDNQHEGDRDDDDDDDDGDDDAGVVFLGNELSLNMCVPLGLLHSVSVADNVIYQPAREDEDGGSGGGGMTAEERRTTWSGARQRTDSFSGRDHSRGGGDHHDAEDNDDDDGGSGVSSNLSDLLGRFRSFGNELLNRGPDPSSSLSTATARPAAAVADGAAVGSGAKASASSSSIASGSGGGGGGYASHPFVTNISFDQSDDTDGSDIVAMPAHGSEFATPQSPASPVKRTRATASPPKKQQLGYTLWIQCKDVRTVKITFVVGRSGNQRTTQNLVSVFARRLEDAIVSSSEVLATHGGRATRGDDWHRYTPVAEFKRQGIYDDIDNARLHPWTTTRINSSYNLCPTYPSILYVPRAIPDSVLRGSAAFRSSQRLPVLTWYSARGGRQRAIIRCAQPLVGAVARKSDDDICLVTQLRKMGSNQDHIVICDARSILAAGGNRVLGKGSEDPSVYPQIKMYYMSIANIHTVRQSFESLRELCCRGSEKKWYGKLEGTGWLAHTRSILSASRVVARKVEQLGVSAIVHCSDGWDRTSQIVALAQLMLDPFYRTLQGFIVLVEKDWLSFGHKFKARLGSVDQPNENSPIFLQFLDCVWQFVRQAPDSFEFNSAFLLLLADHCQSRWFGTFCFNCEMERIRNRLSERSASVWSHVFACKHRYTNPTYRRNPAVLFPSCSMKRIVLWEDYFLRYDSTRTEDILDEDEPATFMWVDDRHARVCKDCGLGFTFVRRRHHCRACGHVFCHTCSNRWLELPQHGFKGKQRVCESCYQRISVG